MSEDSIQIMIVEDDPVAAKVYEKLIEKLASFNVVAIAYSGSEALKFLQVFKPNLILLDIYLPDIYGVDVLREIRANYKGIDVIPISAANDADTITEAIRGGVFSYLVKPIDIQKFTDELLRYQNTMGKLKIKEKLDQNEIDAYFNRAENNKSSKNKKNESPLPKGIDRFTLKRVREKLVTVEGSVSAEELAILIGMTDSTARKYLEYLSSIDEMTVDIQYGVVGRPERKYKRKATE